MIVAKYLMVLLVLVLSVVASFVAIFFMLLGMVCLTYSQAVDGRDAVPEWVDASIEAVCEPVADFAHWVYEMFEHIK